MLLLPDLTFLILPFGNTYSCCLNFNPCIRMEQSIFEKIWTKTWYCSATHSTSSSRVSTVSVWIGSWMSGSWCGQGTRPKASNRNVRFIYMRSYLPCDLFPLKKKTLALWHYCIMIFLCLQTSGILLFAPSLIEVRRIPSLPWKATPSRLRTWSSWPNSALLKNTEVASPNWWSAWKAALNMTLTKQVCKTS